MAGIRGTSIRGRQVSHGDDNQCEVINISDYFYVDPEYERGWNDGWRAGGLYVCEKMRVAVGEMDKKIDAHNYHNGNVMNKDKVAMFVFMVYFWCLLFCILFTQDYPDKVMIL